MEIDSPIVINNEVKKTAKAVDVLELQNHLVVVNETESTSHEAGNMTTNEQRTNRQVLSEAIAPIEPEKAAIRPVSVHNARPSHESKQGAQVRVRKNRIKSTRPGGIRGG